MKADVTVTINEKAIAEKLDSLVNDDVMRQIHNEFYRILIPYVPMDEGVLFQNVEITPKYIRYIQEYAHYMYIGAVYGPNIPIKDKVTGEVTGWFSPPGQKKKPTGKSIVYNKDKHPLATKEWDKVAMQTQLELFEKQVRDILVRRAKELYG